MEASCLRCHSNPKDAPKGLTDYYGSERSFNRKEGDASSVVSLRIPLSEAYASANIFSMKLSAILLSVLLCLFTIQYLFYRRYLLKPLEVIQEKATRIATHEEHLGEQIILPFGRELNELTTTFNEMSIKLRHDRDDLEKLVDQRTEALRESETRYRELFDNVSSGVAIYEVMNNGNDFIFRDFNPAAEKIEKTSRKDILGKRVSEVFPGVKAFGVFEVFKRVWQTGKPEYFPENIYKDERDPGSWRETWVFKLPPGEIVAVYNDITDRKRAEDALRRSQENFRHSLDESPMGVRIVTVEGESIYANRAILDIYGYDSVEELKTTPTTNRYTSQSYAEFKIRREKRKAGDDGPSEYEISIVRKNGEIRHLQVFRKEILWDGERQFQVIYQDITARKQAEEKLHEKTHLNQILLDSFPCVALLLCPQTREIIASNTAAAKVGALPGTHCFSTWGQRQDPCPWCLAPALWATGKAQHLEVEALGIFWDAYWIPVAEDIYMHFAFDITDRKETEGKIIESEERYRFLFENMIEGYAYCKMIFEDGQPVDFIYLNVNSAFEKQTGLTNVSGRKVSEVIPGIREANPELFERYARVALTGRPERFEMFIKVLQMWFSISVYSPSHEHFVAVFDVVTDRKRSEEELRASEQKLRALAERIQKIREEEMVLISREIHDTMGGGLTGLKMDINWLMHNVKKAESDKEQAAMMMRFLSANENIDNMIKVTRRISTGLRPPVLDDLGLIAALEWQLSDLTSRAGIPHEIATAFEYVSMEKDKAVAVFRIFQETLTNIMRHSQATKVVVILREEDERSLFGDENIILEIRDNGRGITEEEILKPESLGLLGMKERAMAFGGELSIRGEPGGGTAVVLKIPRKQGETS